MRNFDRIVRNHVTFAMNSFFLKTAKGKKNQA
jgi:hypothetical protein